jgi:hypothetical protein
MSDINCDRTPEAEAASRSSPKLAYVFCLERWNCENHRISLFDYRGSPVLRLRWYDGVEADMNGHVLLSPTRRADCSSGFYECKHRNAASLRWLYECRLLNIGVRSIAHSVRVSLPKFHLRTGERQPRKL